MKLELNVREWLALYGLLERNVTTPDKQLTEVHNRMRSELITMLNDVSREPFDKWYAATQRKIDQLNTEQVTEVLTADDDTTSQDYPRRRSGKSSGQAKRR